ncbi:aromatase/cyclase [Streptomyces sp. NPDC006355]|uniref:aromatase/cyclase n=1 Tax=Streptomyces sp. NPDC006355 TaxID=3156758 RepID=UPI0033B54C8A
MAVERTRCAQHEVTIAAPAGVVYGLLADAAHWPRYFPSIIHVEQLEFDGRQERHRLWDSVEGQVLSCTSRLTFSPDLRQVEYRHEQPAPPLTSMCGSWSVEELDQRHTRLIWRSTFTVAGDDPQDAAWAERTIDTTARLNLNSLRHHAQRWSDLDELVLSFEDTVRVNGPAELAYDLLYRARDWPELLPFVSRLDVRESPPGVQLVRMETEAMGGLPAAPTETVRICFPHAGRIVFKRTLAPSLLTTHIGEWSVLPDATGATVTAHQCVVLSQEDIEPLLGAGADVPQARRHVRESLGRLSRATLELAKQHAECAIRVL